MSNDWLYLKDIDGVELQLILYADGDITIRVDGESTVLFRREEAEELARKILAWRPYIPSGGF